MANNSLNHRNFIPAEDQLSAQSGSYDLFHALDAELRSDEFGGHVQHHEHHMYNQYPVQHHPHHPHQQHPHRHDRDHVLPPMSSFSQSFPSPGDCHPKYHSFNESAEDPAIDFNQILTMGCEGSDKSHHRTHQQQPHHHQEYIQSFTSPALTYPNSFSGGDQSDQPLMSGSEVTMSESSNAITSHEYLSANTTTSMDSQVVGSSGNSFYGSYVLSGPGTDFAVSHSMSSNMDISQQQKSSHSQHADHAAAGYPFQSHDHHVPVASSVSRPRSAFSHPFTCSDFFSFGMDDAETSESLIDLQSTLDLLPPTPQPAAAAQTILSMDEQTAAESVTHHHQDHDKQHQQQSQDQFAAPHHSFPSSGDFCFPSRPDGSHSEPVHETSPSDSLVQQVGCFKCKLCDFICLQRSGVLMHISERHGSSLQSSLSSSSSSSSASPTSSGGGDQSLACSFCHKSFTSREQCSTHMEADHQITTCLSQGHESSTRPPSASQSIADMVSVSPVPVLQSNPSNASAAQNRSLVSTQSPSRASVTEKSQSLENNHQPNNNTIIKSKNNASKSKKNAWHAKRVKEQGTYICSKRKCSVRFVSNDNMDRHLKCHMDDGSGFCCCECDKFRSENWGSCAGHLWREHNIDMELYKCEQCEYRTHSFSMLENVHRKIHSSEKNHVCSICNKGFKNQKQLVNHKVRHDKRPCDNVLSSAENKSLSKKGAKVCNYECELCGKAFPESRPLRIHMDMVHKKKRPYLCQQCGHSAASKGALRVHIRSHTGEKPFKCEDCEYSTSDHNSLRRHKMRHTGERPYRCPFCAYACIQSSTYKQHLRNKHPNESEGVMFTCSCGFKTVNEEIFRTHTTEHRNTSSVPVRLKRAAARAQSRSDGESSSSSCSSSSSPPQSSSPESPIMQLARVMAGAETPECIVACKTTSTEAGEESSIVSQLVHNQSLVNS